jgi:hypothetical protein
MPLGVKPIPTKKVEEQDETPDEKNKEDDEYNIFDVYNINDEVKQHENTLDEIPNEAQDKIPDEAQDDIPNEAPDEEPNEVEQHETPLEEEPNEESNEVPDVVPDDETVNSNNGLDIADFFKKKPSTFGQVNHLPLEPILTRGQKSAQTKREKQAKLNEAVEYEKLHVNPNSFTQKELPGARMIEIIQQAITDGNFNDINLKRKTRVEIGQIFSQLPDSYKKRENVFM